MARKYGKKFEEHLFSIIQKKIRVKMKNIILCGMCLLLSISTYAKNIQINQVVDSKAINCNVFSKPESKIVPLLQDFSGDGKKNLKLNKSKQTLTIGKNTYMGVQAYQYYKTAHTEQEDLAVNFKVYGVKVLKIALQGFKSEDGESGSFYFVFEGHPVDVGYHLRKAMGSDWNIENTLEETPQGNSKLSCVFAG